MLENLDPILLSRIQFAFTVSFHIIFPAFTIGMASWLTVIEALYFKTKHPLYMEVYKFGSKIFAVTFGMGVVSGLVLSYQFGTNWSVFSHFSGNILGTIIGFEVLTAFFLEASFLGIMLFGWGRVSNKLHFFSTFIVAFGTIISGFWILSANSWMHTPMGYEIKEGILFPTSWLQIIFNPSFPYRFMHMMVAAFMTTAFVVAGIGAWYLLKHKFVPHAKIMFAMAMLMAVFVAPVQLIIGDFHGLNTFKYQEQKVMAMEGIWEDKKGAALNLIGFPDNEKEVTRFAIKIPKMASFLLTHDFNGQLRGLKNWPKSERPPVATVFWSFRIMVGIGMLMILTGIMAAILFFKKKLFTNKWFFRWCVLMTPSGFIALLAGWVVTEVGRQPYMVWGLLRTSEAVSPVQGSLVGISLLAFIVIYTLVFGAGFYYIYKLVKKGPIVGTWHDTYAGVSLYS